jgi:hypothetical protein
MTDHKSPQAKTWSPARESDAGNVQGVIGYLPLGHGLTLAQNDVIEMVKVPLGAIVMDCVFEHGAYGANTLASVGDGNVVDRYILATTDVAAAGVHRRNQTAGVGVPHRYAAQDTVDIKLTNENPTDNIAARLDVFYICGVDETP